MQKSPKKTTTKLLKVPGVLEDYLFQKPDLALVFNELPVSHKNEWIRAIHKVKNEKAMVELLQKLEAKYSEQTAE